jgi:hypothetical protein
VCLLCVCHCAAFNALHHSHIMTRLFDSSTRFVGALIGFNVESAERRERERERERERDGICFGSEVLCSGCAKRILACLPRFAFARVHLWLGTWWRLVLHGLRSSVSPISSTSATRSSYELSLDAVSHSAPSVARFRSAVMLGVYWSWMYDIIHPSCCLRAQLTSCSSTVLDYGDAVLWFWRFFFAKAYDRYVRMP